MPTMTCKTAKTNSGIPKSTIAFVQPINNSRPVP